THYDREDAVSYEVYWAMPEAERLARAALLEVLVLLASALVPTGYLLKLQLFSDSRLAIGMPRIMTSERMISASGGRDRRLRRLGRGEARVDLVRFRGG